MNDEQTLDQVASNILAARQGQYLDNDLPAAVAEKYAEVFGGVQEQLGAAEQMSADLRALESRRDLIPQHGFSRLQNEATGQATTRHAAGARQAAEALEGLQAELLEAAMPVLSGARETAARQELSLLLGSASGPKAQKAVTAICQTASPEVLACLLTPFGRSLLATKGVAGRDYDATLKHAKALVVRRMATEGETARSRKAAELYGQVPQLGAAVGAAGTHFNLKTRPVRNARAASNSHM